MDASEHWIMREINGSVAEHYSWNPAGTRSLLDICGLGPCARVTAEPMTLKPTHIPKTKHIPTSVAGVIFINLPPFTGAPLETALSTCGVGICSVSAALSVRPESTQRYI